MSLIEILVGMGIMSVVGALFTSAILQVYRITGQVEGITRAQTQVRLATQRLDTEIRYAYGIAAPSTPAEAAASSGAWYVEFLRADASTGATECRQLRLEDGVLSLRHWVPGTPPAPGQAGTVLASELDMSSYTTGSPGGKPVPFELRAPGPESAAPTTGVGSGFAPNFQRLRVRLFTKVGDRPMSADTTFVAMNAPGTSESTSTSGSTGSKADECRLEGRSQP
jgi:hypothetical protein